jgi:pilin isopeptide linkage protein
MDNNMGRKPTKERTARRRPMGQRLLALLLTLMMVLGSTGGMQIQADDESTTTPINLENYLTTESTMHITVYIDGVKHTYTPDELAAKNLTVPKGAPVKVELYFDTIPKVSQGQTLVYQLPANLMDYSAADAEGIVWRDTVWEENNIGAEVEAADWTIDSNGTLTVKIRDDFFAENKHDDGTLDLFGFNIKFSGSFSSNRGETSGNGDNEITFRGDTDGTGRISFTIPFEYRNENANVQVDKQITDFDIYNKIATYKVTLTAPDTNLYTATNVVMTDVIWLDMSNFVMDSKTGQVFGNIKASTGDFDSETGVWTVGDMTPGQVETLTYTVKIKSDVYNGHTVDAIGNKATVTFNDDGMHESDAILRVPEVDLSKTASTYSRSIYEKALALATDEYGSYATYTLTVTATGDESNITVKDSIGDDFTYVTELRAADGYPTVGTVTYDSFSPSLTWKIDSMKEGDTATLVYKAYLKTDAWTTTSSKHELTNNASLYVGNGETEAAVPVTGDKTTFNSYKDWVTKSGQKVTDTSDPHYGMMEYTVCVNKEPISDNITSIYDNLRAGGTYAPGNLVINRYTSSDKRDGTFVDTTEIPMSEIVTEDKDNGGYRWDIDLVARKLNGAYYYEITYYVESSAVLVTNYAGIGFGYGPGYYVGSTIEGGGGMTYGKDYSKKIVSDSKQNATTTWQVTVQNKIPEGAIYEDRLAKEYVYQVEQFWFDDEVLKEIEIKFNGKTLVDGEDYTVEGLREEHGAWSDKTDPNHERYNKFHITFLKEFEASSTNKLVITYKVRNNATPKDEDYRDPNYTGLSYNYCSWFIPQYGELVQTAEGANFDRGSFSWDTPLGKDNGTYNADTGTVTWKITVNNNTTLEGDATLVEYLPEGLTYDSISVYRPYDKLSYDTTLGDITTGTYVNDAGVTCQKVIIPIKNLHAYQVTSSRFPTGVGPYDGWSGAGRIDLTLTTKVDDDWYMNLSKDTRLTNKATLTDNKLLPEGGVSATGTVTIPHTTLIDKSQAGRDNPAYVEYALNINPDSANLASDQDTLQVVDVMGAGMSIATAHANCFKVYDVSNVSGIDGLSGADLANLAAQSGQDITDQCSYQDVTGQKLDGLTEDDVGKPTYLITVPDSRHVVIVYWAAFEGADGDSVTISNKASFFYKDKAQSGGGDQTSSNTAVSAASSSVFTGPWFSLQKTDQYGNTVSGVKYTLYKVTLDGSGNVASKTAIMSQTTSADAAVYFGHRQSDSGEALDKSTLYCLIEEEAPAGYVIDSKPYYIAFSSGVKAPTGETLHLIGTGGTCAFINQFTPADLEVPVKKTINGKNLESSTEFTFTLKQTSGETVYTAYGATNTALPEAGIQTTIAGSGSTTFPALYFTQVGTYEFDLTEGDLSTAATSDGYSKDTSTFKVTIVVGKDDKGGLTVKSATYTKNGAAVDVPAFDNKITLTGTITLTAKKVVENRAATVKANEFGFTVSVGGEVIAETNADGSTKLGTDGKPVKKVFYTQDGGSISIEIPVDQDDIGTQTYVISEVQGDDPTIGYTNDRVRVKVTISELGGGKVGIKNSATDIVYVNDVDTFTNTYKASGSLTLQGTKSLVNKNNQSVTVRNGEFNFVVKEGTTQVATGTTETGGNIKFTDITYDASDIGDHTYTITEKDEGEMFVEYSEQSHTVKVYVSDNGDGILSAAVTEVDGKKITDAKDVQAAILFNNIYTLIVPSGIRMDFLPYALVVLLAGGLGAATILRRRKQRKHHA